MTNPRDVIVKRLTLLGDGVFNMAVDGSVTPQVFIYRPPEGRIFRASRMLFLVQDTGNFTANTFGALGAALTNGVQLGVYNDVDNQYILDITGGEPIKTNAGWARIMYDVRYDSYGAGDNYLVARFNFEAFSQGIVFDSSAYFRCVISDNLTGLVRFLATVEGYVLPRSKY